MTVTRRLFELKMGRLAAVLAMGLMGVLPALYLATGLWLRYRRRRA